MVANLVQRLLANLLQSTGRLIRKGIVLRVSATPVNFFSTYSYKIKSTEIYLF